MRTITLSIVALAVSAASLQMAAASQQSESKGFIEESTFNILNRTFYFNRDFRNGGFNGAGTNGAKPGRENGYREEAAHGIMAVFESGFTQGTVGFGVDAYGHLGIKLDSGGGRTGTALLPVGSDGRPSDDYSEAGGVVKARLSNTTLKVGEKRVENPMVATGDARLLPQTATGIFLNSDEIDSLNIDAGHITAMNEFGSTNSDGELQIQYAGNVGDTADWAGGTYTASDSLSLSLFASEVEDTWRRYYGNANYTLPLGDKRSLNFDFNIYRTLDEGKALVGAIDNTTWSLASQYAMGPHALTLAFQKVDGNDGFDYIGFNAIYLANSVQYSDFNAPREESWQLRYDLNLADYGVPGLTLMARYIRGDNIDSSDADPLSGFFDAAATNEKHWERDLEAKYVVQDGAAKDLSLRVRQATHRGSSNQIDGDVDEVRFIVEYPLSVL
ncbi:OprD family porin [Pseudomonas lalucatii]|uniref:OprD family porin n=1 Tax=Pseudomonas lalucatii TaxID=1424203 RepID=A0ABS5PY45_9PSED|nr:OprD family porin [Pseudomonas lalucatii]MBS7661402.1 OprD family porin [Pseudomonas lalucatii]MBS7691778.1 OprD family porin [Pseudomonas lalucatii]MBS7724109.1 OprD family porin [Pseudomonas lalucatii]QVM87888.1 OprD family porin [Pseudomonas lalucatii]